MEIKLEATTAHLWFEEAIGGDKTIDIEAIWAHLDQSEWYAQAMLDGGTNEEGTFLALKDPDLRLQIENTIDGIRHFRQIAQKRWALQATSGLGSDIEQQFDIAFLKFNLSADSVETVLEKVIAEELQVLKFVQKLLIIFLLILGVVIGGLSLRYNTRRIKNINALKLSEEHVNNSQNQLLNVINGAKLGYWDWCYKTGDHVVNDEWLSMLGLSRQDIKNNISDWERLIHPNDEAFIKRTLQAHILSGKNYAAEFRMKHTDGRWIWIEGSGTVIEYDEKTHEPLRLCGTHQDITERKKAEEKLKLAASVFTHARESIIITDTAGIIIDVNDTFTTTTGYSHEYAIGENPRFLKSGRQPAEFYADMWQALLEKGYWHGELWNRRQNGEVYAEIKTISAVRDEQGIITHYVALGNDITLMKEHQNQLEHIAHNDILTNLPNRSLLADRLSQTMLQCRRHEQSLAVVFLDLDGFKAVNDGYGHDMGDELLIALSVRMKEALRENDTLARFGGDEFVAVLTDLTTVEDCEPVLERLLLAVSEPITIGDIVLNISASLGVTLYPQDNVDADLLIRHADQAMYVAKESGKDRYHLFDTAQDDAVKIQRE
ncbi:MAG: diguanylate cyclase, partial [Colwellia sp.]|nr:diguanylate cyclase [Colwellia sp.]